MNTYEFRVGWRYVKAKRRKGFLSVTALVSILGVMIGVMALVVALSMASGFQSALRDKIIGVNAHLLLLRADGLIHDWRRCVEKVAALSDVKAVMPFTYQQVLLSSEHEIEGSVVRGVDPGSIGTITSMGLELNCGSWEAIQWEPSMPPSPALTIPPIFLGKTLAENLGVHCGGKVQMIAPSGLPGEREVPASFRQFTVKGIFEVGMYEYDASLALIPLKEAQDFFKIDDTITGIEIRLLSLSKTDSVEQEIEGLFGYPFWIKSWKEINQNFFSALQLQKAVMFIVLTLIVLVGAFNIISTLILTVMDKTKEIAILRSMGATKEAIIRIFAMQGVALGGIGSLLGLSGGYVLASLAGKYPLVRLDPDIYYLSSLPVEIRIKEFLLVGACAMILCVLASLYPAYQAGKLDPTEVLRYV